MYQKIILIGRLGRDPEMRYTPDGTPITSFSVATDQKWNDQSGQLQTHHLVSRNGLATLGRNMQPISRQRPPRDG